MKWLALALAATGCDVVAGLDELPTADLAPGCSGTRLLRTFGSGALDPIWTSGGAATIVPMDTAIHFDAVPQSGQSYVTANANLDLRGDEFSVGVDLAGTMPDGQARIDLYSPTRKQGLFFYYSQGTLHFSVRDETGDTDIATLRYDPAAHRYWKIVESAGEIRWQSSADAKTWETRASTPTPAWLSYVSPEVTEVPSLDPIAVTFDHLNGGAPAGVVCRAAALADDFSSPTLSNRWTLQPNPHGTITLTGGQVVATLDGVANGDAVIVSSGIYDLRTSSFALHVVQPPDQATDGTTVFAVSTLDPLSASLTLAHNTMTAGIGGPTGGSFGTAPYDQATTSWWRLRGGGGGVLHWETSADGRTYTEIAQAPGLALDRVQGLFFIGGTSANTATFDSFNAR
jgi:hypothetical protein